MTSHSRRQYQATIRSAHPADLAYYRRVLADCTEYPFAGEGSTALSRAVWMEKTGQLEVKPMNKYKRYMKDRGWHAKKFAAEVGVSVNSLYKVMTGRGSGAAERKVRWYMETNPAGFTRLPSLEQLAAEVSPRTDGPVDITRARAVMGWATDMIDSGKVKSIEIRMEVGE